jgi:phosphohistidine phosphatase
MKQLLIIRNAKSSWDFSVLSDFDRQLNDRGHKDAPMMAQRLLDKKIAIDAFITSSANRAFTTATYFAKAYNQAEESIIKHPELYHASANMLFNVISNTNNKYKNIAVFSHNPGITEFANELTDTQISDMPTCGIFAVKAGCKNWEDFRTAKKEFLFFDFPKNI